ncbi:phasin family protein [Coralliovum pocilloporae]|uniref:phasin family protein n=1 Tax=Coralliovum pocilloporae TaxID=3066369 RepID=UPI00330735BA
MFQGFDEIQKMSKDNVDTAVKSFGVVSQGFQAIAVEMTDYSKKSFEDGVAVAEKMMAVKSIDKAVEVQSDYAKSAYEAFVGHATKVGELYADLAKEAYKPVEGVLAKAAK